MAYGTWSFNANNSFICKNSHIDFKSPAVKNSVVLPTTPFLLEIINRFLNFPVLYTGGLCTTPPGIDLRSVLESLLSGPTFNIDFYRSYNFMTYGTRRFTTTFTRVLQ